MNMLSNVEDDMRIREFRELWISKRGELDAIFDDGETKCGVSQPQVQVKSEHENVPHVSKLPSEYVVFCRIHREEVKLKNPEMKSVDITRELARLWKIEKETRVKKQVKPQEEKQIEPKKKLVIKAKVMSKPKPEVLSKEEDETEYITFCKETRLKIKEKYPEMNPLEITRELANEWKKHQLVARNEITSIIEQSIE